jgi:hypothetical protein
MLMVHTKVRVTVAAACLLTLTAGCGQREPKTYPVAGKVVLSGGDTAKLVGHYVEAALESDPAVRASGVIGPDGNFTLETLHAGAILTGAREGKYQVRIVPADEDDEGRKLKQPPVSPKHLKFETSGLSFQVPANGNVTLQVASR